LLLTLTFPALFRGLSRMVRSACRGNATRNKGH
jgi:hypothetical protein